MLSLDPTSFHQPIHEYEYDYRNSIKFNHRAMDSTYVCVSLSTIDGSTVDRQQCDNVMDIGIVALIFIRIFSTIDGSMR